MKKDIHRAASRGLADHGWLKSRHSFSFANYFNPNRMGFGALRVINDDWVDPARGFDAHSHQNMEIVSIPLEGALEHKDSEGHQRIIKPGEIQIMSAGRGVTHSEYNHSSKGAVNFLQIWVLPKEQNITPKYGQKNFAPDQSKGKVQCVISPDEREGSLWINQDAYFSLAELEEGQGLRYPAYQPGSGIYVFVIEGKVETLDENLNTRDAMGIREVSELEIKAHSNSEVLFIEVPMNEA